MARTKGIGAVSAEDALDFGMTGPALRASGVAEDVRISEPYGIYDRFDFGIPVGTYGDCWDRYYVAGGGDAAVDADYRAGDGADGGWGR